MLAIKWTIHGSVTGLIRKSGSVWDGYEKEHYILCYSDVFLSTIQSSSKTMKPLLFKDSKNKPVGKWPIVSCPELRNDEICICVKSRFLPQVAPNSTLVVSQCLDGCALKTQKTLFYLYQHQNDTWPRDYDCTMSKPQTHTWEGIWNTKAYTI